MKRFELIMVIIFGIVGFAIVAGTVLQRRELTRYNVTTASGQEINVVFVEFESENWSKFYDPYGTTYIVRETYKKEPRK